MMWLFIKFFVLVNGEERLAGGFAVGAVFAGATAEGLADGRDFIAQ